MHSVFAHALPYGLPAIVSVYSHRSKISYTRWSESRAQ